MRKATKVLLLIGAVGLVWVVWLAVNGQAYTGTAQHVRDVPEFGESIAWLEPDGPVQYVVYRGIRGPTGFVSGHTTTDLVERASSKHLHTQFSDGEHLPKLIGEFTGGNTSQFRTKFAADDPVFIGTLADGTLVEVYFSRSDRDFTARLIRSNDRPRS
jgi:hypothetical protein